MRFKLKLGVVSLALAPRWATAAVVDASGSGFTVRTTIAIRAAPGEVYRRLVRNVGDWWDPSHTFSGNAHNLSIEEKAAGCFCEKLPDGGRRPPHGGCVLRAWQDAPVERRAGPNAVDGGGRKDDD